MMTMTLHSSEKTGISNSILEAVGHTPLVRLHRVFSEFPGTTVLAKLEILNPSGSMKDRVGLSMIEDAERAGRIFPGDTLVEPSSGNTGLGLAMAAAVKGYQLIITMPDKISIEKQQLLKAYGAEVILAPTALAFDDPNGYIEVAKRLVRERPNTHMLNQYSHPGNPKAHYTGTGPEIWEQTDGQIDVFACGMGTGGTISGTAQFLKLKNPKVHVLGIDPEGSIYTGDTPRPYHMEGIGYDFYPEVFDVGIVDEMIRVSDADAFMEARRLAREEGILAGGSTGAVVAGVRRFLQSHGDEGLTLVLMVHDTGRNYLSKLYNDDWMRDHGFSS